MQISTKQVRAAVAEAGCRNPLQVFTAKHKDGSRRIKFWGCAEPFEIAYIMRKLGATEITYPKSFYPGLKSVAGIFPA